MTERDKAIRRAIKSLTEKGYDVRRGPGGSRGDIHGIDGLWVRCITGTASVRKALADSREAWPGSIRAIIKTDQRAPEPTVTMGMDDWLEFLGYYHDFIRLCRWHHPDVDPDDLPPEPETDIWEIGEVWPDDVEGWIARTYKPYMAWVEGEQRPWPRYYVGNGKWCEAAGRFTTFHVTMWKEIPGSKDREKL